MNVQMPVDVHSWKDRMEVGFANYLYSQSPKLTNALASANYSSIDLLLLNECTGLCKLSYNLYSYS